MYILYRQFDATGTLLYVGCTCNVKQRSRSHKYTAPWWAAIVKVTREEFPDRAAARAAERQAIETEHPAHNVQRNRPLCARCGREKTNVKWKSHGGYRFHVRYCIHCDRTYQKKWREAKGWTRVRPPRRSPQKILEKEIV